MPVRVFLAGAAEAHRRIRLKSEFGGIESGVLIGEHERRRQGAIAERMGDRRQFYSFRSGADDQPYVGKTQSFPYLGGRKLPPLWTKLNGNCRRRPGFSS